MAHSEKQSDISYVRADAKTLRAMLDVFARGFEDQETYLGNVPSDAYLESMAARDDFFPIAAVSEARVVGALAAYLLRKFEQERSEIYIYDLAVDEGFRRRGIATGMINRLRSIARELGVWVIYVQADHGDDPAIKLYESLGIREDVLHFDIEP
jgi:aminoglycoside 3-N-acetyltransferase I